MAARVDDPDIAAAIRAVAEAQVVDPCLPGLQGCLWRPAQDAPGPAAAGRTAWHLRSCRTAP
ncbi:hypothetical protein ACU4GD_39340 [Cupriavidus basilensis]